MKTKTIHTKVQSPESRVERQHSGPRPSTLGPRLILLLLTFALFATFARPLHAGEANVHLTWSPRPANENVQYYIISEELTPGRAILGTTTATSAVVTNVANGAHKYFVSAVNAHGEGLPSATFNFTVYNYPIASPGIPSGVSGYVNYTFP